MTLVWLNWLETHKSKQKHYAMLSTWREFTPPCVKLWRSIWFQLPYDNSQRLSKHKVSLTWKDSIHCINAKLSHDTIKSQKCVDLSRGSSPQNQQGYNTYWIPTLIGTHNYRNWRMCFAMILVIMNITRHCSFAGSWPKGHLLPWLHRGREQ